jgi:hypothetical protein
LIRLNPTRWWTHHPNWIPEYDLCRPTSTYFVSPTTHQPVDYWTVLVQSHALPMIQVAIQIQDFNTVIDAVYNEHICIARDANSIRVGQLSFSWSFTAPLLKERPISSEHRHARCWMLWHQQEVAMEAHFNWPIKSAIAATSSSKVLFGSRSQHLNTIIYSVTNESSSLHNAMPRITLNFQMNCPMSPFSSRKFLANRRPGSDCRLHLSRERSPKDSGIVHHLFHPNPN